MSIIKLKLIIDNFFGFVKMNNRDVKYNYTNQAARILFRFSEKEES